MVGVFGVVKDLWISRIPAQTASTATMWRKMFWLGIKTEAKIAKKVRATPISTGERASEGPDAWGGFLKTGSEDGDYRDQGLGCPFYQLD